MPSPVLRVSETPETLKVVFFFNDTATTEIYSLSLHDALPILVQLVLVTELLLENEPTPLRLRLTEIPSGDATYPPPTPRLWKTFAFTASPAVLALVLISSGVCCKPSVM